MLEFFKNNFFAVMSLFISLISLFISLLNFYNSRKRLDVVIESELDRIENIYLNTLDYNNKKPSLNFGSGYVSFIKIVNPSPSDIAFFDLRVVDLNTMKPIFFITEGTLELAKLSNEILFYDSNVAMGKLNIPASNYGILKSNSFTRLEIAFYPPKEKCKVLISFKVAISTLKTNKESVYRNKFKYYKKIYTIGC